MNTRQDVQDFLAQKTLAMAGISRNPQAFSTRTFKELVQKGYKVIPVNPNAESIEGQKCYPSVKKLPEKVGGVLIFTPPSETEKVAREAAAAGIRRIWIQQGAQSEAALGFCRENGLPAVSGQCILMFAEPVASFHGFHRWVKGLFGRLPK
jgi:predicted CoA-binding protein